MLTPLKASLDFKMYAILCLAQMDIFISAQSFSIRRSGTRRNAIGRARAQRSAKYTRTYAWERVEFRFVSKNSEVWMFESVKRYHDTMIQSFVDQTRIVSSSRIVSMLWAAVSSHCPSFIFLGLSYSSLISGLKRVNEIQKSKSLVNWIKPNV